MFSSCGKEREAGTRAVCIFGERPPHDRAKRSRSRASAQTQTQRAQRCCRVRVLSRSQCSHPCMTTFKATHLLLHLPNPLRKCISLLRNTTEVIVVFVADAWNKTKNGNPTCVCSPSKARMLRRLSLAWSIMETELFGQDVFSCRAFDTVHVVPPNLFIDTYSRPGSHSIGHVMCGTADPMTYRGGRAAIERRTEIFGAFACKRALH